MTMPVNYFDPTFSSFAYDQIDHTDQLPYIFYEDYRLVPGGCDAIGITFWTGNFNNHTNVVNDLLPKTKKLLIFAPEPVKIDQFINFINLFENHPQVTVFGNASLNFKNPKNYIAVPNWFIDCENFYVTKSWAKRLLASLTFDFNKPKKFDCLLGKEKSHRNLIEKKYLESNHKDEIIFTYFKNDILSGSWDFDIQGSSVTGKEIVIDGEIGRISAILPINIYNNSHYSIVAETTSSNDYSHFTEKTAKPLVAKRPFVMFAGQHFLKNLHSLGFKTFDTVIDETYDSIENQDLRFAAAWEQVERLCELDPVAVISRLTPTLIHNRQHFLNTSWHDLIRKSIVL